MDNPVLLQILGVVVTLFFIFALVMSAKSWPWYNILAAFSVFCVAIYFATQAAMVLKTHTAWREIHKRLDQQLQPELQKTEMLLVGTVENAADPMGTLPRALAQFQRVLLHRGRVWRNCTAEKIQPTEVVLAMPRVPAPPPPAPDPAPMPGAMPTDPNAPVDPNAPPAAAPVDPNAAPAPPPPPEPRPNVIKEKSVVYLFTEKRLSETVVVPAAFLGEWEALAVTETNVTLRPVLPLDAVQSGLLNAGNATFVIYEQLPIDSMNAYDEYFALAGVERTDEQLRALIVKLPGVSDEVYNRRILEFLRDGKEKLDSDPPERVWTRVKFLKAKEMEVDSTTLEVNAESQYFKKGLALQPDLRHGQSVKFSAGAVAVFPQADAKLLIDDQTCEKMEDLYRRELRDYKTLFRLVHDRLDEVQARIAEVKVQKETLEADIGKTQMILDSLTSTREKLEKDKDRVVLESKLLAAYLTRLEAFKAGVKANGRRLYDDNLAKAHTYAERQKQLTDEINRRTRETAAAASR